MFIYVSISLIYPFNVYNLFIIKVYIQYFIILNIFYIMVPIIIIIGYYIYYRNQYLFYMWNINI